jgi:hypothetical protein
MYAMDSVQREVAMNANLMDARRAAAEAREAMIKEGQEMWDARRRTTTTIDPMGRKTVVIQTEEGDDDQNEPRSRSKQKASAEEGNDDRDETRKGRDKMNQHASGSFDARMNDSYGQLLRLQDEQRAAAQARLRDGAQFIRDQADRINALWRDGRAAAGAEDARRAWIKDAENAWHRDAKPVEQPVVQDSQPINFEDAQRRKQLAYDEMVKAGQAAWRNGRR